MTTSGANGDVGKSVADSRWSSKRQYLDPTALRAAPPEMVAIHPPSGAYSPTHTDDDPAADHVGPIASETERSPSRRSPITPNQTARPSWPPGDSRRVTTATSKSSPTPPLTPSKAPTSRPPSTSALPIPILDSTRLSAPPALPYTERCLATPRSRNNAPRRRGHTQRSRPHRRNHSLHADPPRLRPNAHSAPNLQVVREAQNHNTSMFPNDSRLQALIIQSVESSLSRGSSEASEPSVPRHGYGPTRLMPNTSTDTTPRSAASTLVVAETQDDPLPTRKRSMAPHGGGLLNAGV